MNRQRPQVSLLVQFSLLSFIVTALIAVALGYLLQQELIENTLEQEATRAADQVQYIVAPSLDLTDFAGIQPAKLAALDAQVRDLSLMRNIVRIKLWNQQGVLIYADEKDLIGKTFPISAELRDALNGKFSKHISTLTKAENASERDRAQQALEIYVPIRWRTGSQVIGAYEIYQDLRVITPALNEIQRLVYGGLGIGFLVLYLSVFAIVRGASQALVRHSEENTLLYSRERKRAQQMQIINDISRQLSSILEPDQLLNEILQVITTRFHYERASVNLLRDRRFVQAKLCGYPPELQTHPEDLPHIHIGEKRDLITLAAETGKSIMIADVNIDARWIPYAPTDPTRSAIAVPMIAHSQVIGVIGIASDRLNAFEQSDVTALELLSAQAAVAIENAQLYAIARRNMRNLSALRSIDHAISTTLDLKHTLALLLDYAVIHTGYENGSGFVALVDPSTRCLKIAAAKNLGTPFIERFNLRVGESIAGRVAEDGKPRIVTDLTGDPRATLRDLNATENLVSLLAVPLRAEGGVIGVLVVHTRQRHRFTDAERDFFMTMGGQAAIAVQNAQLYERTKEQANALTRLTQQLEASYTETLAAMSAALDARDSGMTGHSHRVAEWTVQLARALGITDAAELLALERGALLHDIGKIGVSDTILKKAGPLSAEERTAAQRHTLIGAEILRGITFLEPAVALVRHHHEHWDGTGYPEGLAGEAIPLAARIFGVVDAYDTLTSARHYRDAISHEQAVAKIRALSGTHCDPVIVEKFLQIISTNDA